MAKATLEAHVGIEPTSRIYEIRVLPLHQSALNRFTHLPLDFLFFFAVISYRIFLALAWAVPTIRTTQCVILPESSLLFVADAIDFVN